jgi:hypothetical protein
MEHKRQREMRAARTSLRSTGLPEAGSGESADAANEEACLSEVVKGGVATAASAVITNRTCICNNPTTPNVTATYPTTTRNIPAAAAATTAAVTRVARTADDAMTL